MLAAHINKPPIRPNMLPNKSTVPIKPNSRSLSLVAGSGRDVLGGGGGGRGGGGGGSCVGRVGGRGGGAGREDEPAANCLSYSSRLAGSLRISHASFSRLVVASALGLGFWSG